MRKCENRVKSCCRAHFSRFHAASHATKKHAARAMHGHAAGARARRRMPLRTTQPRMNAVVADRPSERSTAPAGLDPDPARGRRPRPAMVVDDPCEYTDRVSRIASKSILRCRARMFAIDRSHASGCVRTSREATIERATRTRRMGSRAPRACHAAPHAIDPLAQAARLEKGSSGFARGGDAARQAGAATDSSQPQTQCSSFSINSA